MKLGDVVRLERVYGAMEGTLMTMAKAKKFDLNMAPLKAEIESFRAARAKGSEKYLTKGETQITPEHKDFQKFVLELEKYTSDTQATLITNIHYEMHTPTTTITYPSNT